MPSDLVSGQDFGKLFTTPEERKYLDGLRDKFLERSELEGFNISEQAKPWLEEDIDDQNVEFEMAGVMSRKNGGKAVWLNGDSVDEKDLPRNVKLVETDGQHRLQIRVLDQTHYIKAGQTINIETGTVRESFEKTPEDSEGGLAASINNIFNSDEPSETEKIKDKSSSEQVGIGDLIEALQTIQGAKNVQ